MEWVANAKPRALTPGRVTWYPLYRRGGGGPIAKFIRNDKSVLSVYKLTPPTRDTEQHVTETRPCAHDYTCNEQRHIKGISTRGYVSNIIHILCFVCVV